jgi:magnesium transporter
MPLNKKNSARLRDEERARLIWLLTTDKALVSALLGKLTLAEQYDVGTLADDIAEVGALVAHLPPPDLADTLEALPSEERHALWRLVEDHERGQVLLEASENVWDDLIDEMSDHAILDALATLDIDEQIYLVQHLPRNLTGRLLASMPADERARVRQVMHYEKNSVGAIMEFGVILIRPDVTLGTVQRYLRRLGKMPDNTDKLFVTSRDKTLLGELDLQTILLNSAHKRVSEVMEPDPVIFMPEDDAEKAARTFERDNLLSAAVVDSTGKVMGRLTIDEIVDVVYEETDNDMRALGGLSAEEDVYAPVSKAVKTRWAWLAINLCTAFIASRVIDGFEHTISQLVALASLMPIVAGIGGHYKADSTPFDWSHLAQSRQTLAIYMGTMKAAEISAQLIQHGRNANTPVAVISRGTRVDQQVTIGTLQQLATLAKDAPMPALIVVGEVVELHKTLAWFQHTTDAEGFGSSVVNLA